MAKWTGLWGGGIPGEESKKEGAAKFLNKGVLRVSEEQHGD
jgi:hypothetical protein